MREILFRGKRRDTGEWVDGLLFNEYSTFLLRFLWKIQHINKFGMPIAHYEIDPETVGQYTGLTDKNGKRIFEGDIIQTKRKEKAYRFVVKYGEYIPKHYCREEYSEHNTIGFYCDSNTGHYQLSASSNVVEVIGNIHDNPELLEGDQNETQ